MKKVHSILVAASFTLAIALTPSCSGGGGGGDGGGSEKSLLLNFTSDYANGELRWLNPDSTPLTLDNDYINFDQDSKVFAYKGQIFLLERPTVGTSPNIVTNGTLNCFDPPLSNATIPTKTALADSSNPSDIAFIDKKGYIAQYGLNYLVVFGVNGCNKLDTINLPNVISNTTMFPPGSSSNAISIKAKGSTLLVVMQRWTAYPDSATNGILVRINANNKKLIDTIPLTYRNPQTSILHGDTLYIGSAFSLNDQPYGPGINTAVSGVEYVSLSNKNKGVLVSGTTLNGGVTSMALDSAGQLYLAVYRTWGNVPLYRVPPSSSGPIQVQGIVQATCMVYDYKTSKLFIGNGTAYSPSVLDPSLMYYNTTTPAVPADTVDNSKTTDNAYPPYSLAIVRYRTN